MFVPWLPYDKGVASYIKLADVCIRNGSFFYSSARKKTGKQSFNADGNPKITTKGHLPQFRLCTLQKVRYIHTRTLVGHLFSELFFELSHIYLITFCSNKHVLASVFISVSESLTLHRLF